MTMQYIRTNSENKDFQTMILQLDQYLAGVNGDANDFFVQYNTIDLIHHTIVVYENGVAVGCGAIKAFDENSMEIKRMFVSTAHRRKGIAKEILNELTSWSKELHYKKCILETSKSMTDAVQLYTNYGFAIIPNYGPYKNEESSICFEKII